MRSTIKSGILLLTLSLTFLGWTELVHAQSDVMIKVKEEKSIVFYVVGMKTIDDARVTEELLYDLPGVMRARTSSVSFMSSCVTYVGSDIDEQTIADLMKTAGFTITDYSERLIGNPSELAKTKVLKGPMLRSPGDPASVGQDEYKMTDSEIKEKIKEYEDMREAAVKRGTPTKKYDDEITWLKSELEK